MSEEQAANFYEQRYYFYLNFIHFVRKNEIQRNIQKISKAKGGNKKKAPKSSIHISSVYKLHLVSDQVKNIQPGSNKEFSVLSPNATPSSNEAQRRKGNRLTAQENTKVVENAREDNKRQNEQASKNIEQNKEQSKRRTPSNGFNVETNVTVHSIAKGKSSNEPTPKNVYSKEQTPKAKKEQLKQAAVNRGDEENDESSKNKFGDAIQIARDSIFQRMENIERALNNKEDSKTPKSRERPGKSEASENINPQPKAIPKTRPGGIKVTDVQAKQPTQSPAKVNTEYLRSPFTAKTDLSTATSPHSSNLIPRGRGDKSAFSKGIESSQVESPNNGIAKERTLKTEESPEINEATEYQPRESYQAIRKNNRYSKDRASLNQPTNIMPTKKYSNPDIKQERGSKIGAQNQRSTEVKTQVIQKFDLSKAKGKNVNLNEGLRSRINQEDTTRYHSN